MGKISTPSLRLPLITLEPPYHEAVAAAMSQAQV
jgi:hypothetical protein